MNYQDRWLLPTGIIEILPEDAFYLEKLHHQLVDLYKSWGYQLVIPPMIEYLESLLVERGDALDLETFKIIDQQTGRLMGFRADMTPQIARINVQHLKRKVPTRLFYLGTVLRARPGKFAGSRSPFQVGAELYGHSGIASDVEILSLLLETLKLANIQNFHIDIGHVGIYCNLVAAAGFTAEQEDQLFEAIKRKSNEEIDALLSQWQVPTLLRDKLSALPYLNGNSDVLKEAWHLFANDSPKIHQALEELEQLIVKFSQIPLYIDLAESRGYKYHTGILFATYVPKHGQAIATGGRYDNLCQLFGQHYPATGFSTNLRTLIELSTQPLKAVRGIYAPCCEDLGLQTMIEQLRKAGEVVIQALPNQPGDAQAMGCDRELRYQNGQWQVVPFKKVYFQ